MTLQLQEPSQGLHPVTSNPTHQKMKLSSKIGKLFGVGVSSSSSTATSLKRQISSSSKSPLVSPTASPGLSPSPGSGSGPSRRPASPAPLLLSSNDAQGNSGLSLSQTDSSTSLSLKNITTATNNNTNNSHTELDLVPDNAELSHNAHRLFSLSNMASSIRSPNVSRQNSTKQQQKPTPTSSAHTSSVQTSRKNSISERKNSVSDRKNSITERETRGSISDRKSSVGSERKGSSSSISVLISSVISQPANKSSTSLNGSDSPQQPPIPVARSSSLKRILPGKKSVSPKPSGTTGGIVTTNPNTLSSIISNDSKSSGLLESNNNDVENNNNNNIKSTTASTSVLSPQPQKHINSPPSQPSSHLSSTTLVNKLRFKMHPDGNHEHNLRYAKRQEKLTNMLKDFLGAKKLRDEAKSALPSIFSGSNVDSTKSQVPNGVNNGPPTLFAGLVKQVKNRQNEDNTSASDTRVIAGILSENGSKSMEKVVSGTSSANDCRSFLEKYGRCQEVIGKGSFGVVRVAHKKVGPGEGNRGEEILYAVKEFKTRANEGEKKYHRRLTSEFCISSSLKHLNIIDTLDLLKDAKGEYCEVMEYCGGGDLFSVIVAAGKLEYAEADCFFKQLIRGVVYMHEMGVTHRDLKPENLLLTTQGVLKITDFGNGECFKMAWENDIQFSEGVCGSSPYIAPEEFVLKSFDPRGVDIWACGVIYMAMRTGRQLWQVANPKEDEFYEEYLAKRKEASGYEPIENLKRARCRNVIYSILDPIPDRRITGKQILNSEWGREIKVCDAGEGKLDHHDSKIYL